MDIHQALNSDPVDIETLRQAAVSEGGLLTDEIRRKVWPKLLSVNVYNLPVKPCECVFVNSSTEKQFNIMSKLTPSLPSKAKDVREGHKDYRQVELDVRRSMRRFPKGRCLICIIPSKASDIDG